MSSFLIHIVSDGYFLLNCNILCISLNKQYANMHGSRDSSNILEFVDSWDLQPRNDKSWVILFFGTNFPLALIPKASATPIGEITRFGISFAQANGKMSCQPFQISFLRPSAKKFSCFKADLWLPLFIAPCRSKIQTCSSIGFIIHLEPTLISFSK